ncbi:MAG: hypothetical protein LBH22_01480 [Bacteroidales bacterium]|jgi:hypothetical protein|nr:hypothetical protein [Bacteroidales bacterium]
MKTKEKTFDAVKMMRDIRDELYENTKGMTFEEFKAFIHNEKPKTTPAKRRVASTPLRKKKEFA